MFAMLITKPQSVYHEDKRFFTSILVAFNISMIHKEGHLGISSVCNQTFRSKATEDDIQCALSTMQHGASDRVVIFRRDLKIVKRYYYISHGKTRVPLYGFS
jgi:hypothetical protein